MYEDKTLKCVDCGQEFVFTAGEQEFYAQKGFVSAPKRCRNCRALKRSQQQSRPTFTAVCARCGAETQRFSAPSPDRPWYCDACYAQIRAEREKA